MYTIQFFATLDKKSVYFYEKKKMHETRLITISSKDAGLGEEGKSSDYAVTFGNLPAEFQNAIRGVSVEAVTFHNVLPNILATDQISYQLNGAGNLSPLVAEDDFYSLEKLAENLNGILSPAVVVDVGVGVGNDGGDRLRFTPDVGVTFELVPRNLSVRVRHILGVDIGKTYITNDPSSPLILRTNLNGESIIRLHTSALTTAHPSISSDDQITSCIATLPITVPYGFIQTYEFGGDHRPLIVYNKNTPFNFFQCDVQFKDADGNIVDFLGTPTYVTFRVYMDQV